jgi:hypothetical protein
MEAGAMSDENEADKRIAACIRTQIEFEKRATSGHNYDVERTRSARDATHVGAVSVLADEIASLHARCRVLETALRNHLACVVQRVEYQRTRAAMGDEGGSVQAYRRGMADGLEDVVKDLTNDLIRLGLEKADE